MDTLTANWYAIYTKPRWEKKVHALITGRKIDCYCPLNKVRRKWSDRYKTIEEPLFKSYVFVKMNEQDMAVVRSVDGVVNFVYWLGKPAIIKEGDIIRIKRFLNEYNSVEVYALGSLKPGAKVLITSGVLMDKSAKVLSHRNKKVILEIETLGCKLVAEVPKDHVLPFKNSSL